MFQNTLSEALETIKCPKISICNSCQSMNDYENDKGVLLDNEEVYNFTTSYFVTEPAYDLKHIEQITNNLKNIKSIEYDINQIGKNDGL